MSGSDLEESRLVLCSGPQRRHATAAVRQGLPMVPEGRKRDHQGPASGECGLIAPFSVEPNRGQPGCSAIQGELDMGSQSRRDFLKVTAAGAAGAAFLPAAGRGADKTVTMVHESSFIPPFDEFIKTTLAEEYE